MQKVADFTHKAKMQFFSKFTAKYKNCYGKCLFM